MNIKIGTSLPFPATTVNFSKSILPSISVFYRPCVDGQTRQTLVRLLFWSSLIWAYTVCSNTNAQISIFSVNRVVYQLIEIQALTVHVAGFPFIYPLYHEIYIIFSSFNIIEKSWHCHSDCHFLKILNECKEWLTKFEKVHQKPNLGVSRHANEKKKLCFAAMCWSGLNVMLIYKWLFLSKTEYLSRHLVWLQNIISLPWFFLGFPPRTFSNQLLQLCTARTAWSDSDSIAAIPGDFRSASVLFGKCTTLVVTKCWPMIIRQPCGDQWKAEKLGAYWRWPITRCLIKSDSS